MHTVYQYIGLLIRWKDSKQIMFISALSIKRIRNVAYESLQGMSRILGLITAEETLNEMSLAFENSSSVYFQHSLSTLRSVKGRLRENSARIMQ